MVSKCDWVLSAYLHEPSIYEQIHGITDFQANQRSNKIKRMGWEFVLQLTTPIINNKCCTNSKIKTAPYLNVHI